MAKVVSEARKPKNQAKAKSMLSSLRDKVSGGSERPARSTTAKGGSERATENRPR